VVGIEDFLRLAQIFFDLAAGIPGFSCIFNTRCALMLPSSASSLSLIFRDAASEISDIEKNALTAIRQSITKILFNISYPASRQILGREV
jgi:hypothetical protein